MKKFANGNFSGLGWVPCPSSILKMTEDVQPLQNRMIKFAVPFEMRKYIFLLLLDVSFIPGVAVSLNPYGVMRRMIG